MHSRHVSFTQPGFTGDDMLYRNTLPDPDDFAAAMARLGVRDGARVVLYDSESTQWASRVWWMLRWIGFDNAAILDGGFTAWRGAGLAVTGQVNQVEPGHLTVHLRPKMFADKSEVETALTNNTLLLDALEPCRFHGEAADLGLSGHIKGAVNIPASGLVRPKSTKFRNPNEITGHFPWPREDKVILYCGSGIAAAALGFVMQDLGYQDIAIYMPGLQEWVQDPNAPMKHRPGLTGAGL